MLLSILIPSYNHEQYVLSTINAASRIEIREKEIIVIDDGSSDGSVSLIQRYISKKSSDSDIRLIARENRGLVATLNEGLSIARGRYFYLVASDDIPIPDGIAQLVALLEKDANLEFALGNALVMDSEQQCEFKTSYGEMHRRFFALPWEKRQQEMFLRYPQPILLQTAVFRTSALRAVGGWRNDIVVDDYALFLTMFSRFTRAGQDFAFHPEIMACFYRQHPTNSFRNVTRQFQMVEQALARLCPPQWRDMALVRNFVAHCIVALREGKPLAAARFFKSTLYCTGLVPFIDSFAAELRRVLLSRLSKKHQPKVEPMVLHEPASATIEHFQNISS
jgi:glycosyltransferase involved in cell wall biosynthesis